jgi:hypothetical protein
LLPLQTVDRFNNLFVTAYVTPGSARFLLLHDGKSDDAIRGFFAEVQELYLRVSSLQDLHLHNLMLQRLQLLCS